MFITFEGIDYSGKTTQAKMLNRYFKKIGLKSLLIREPGGTKISERVRKILLDKKHLEMTPLTEFLLFSASRAQLVSQIIKPNLKKNIIVICDRFYDSSTAYQSYGGNLSLKKISEINKFASDGLTPDITFLIKLNPKKAFERAKRILRSAKNDREDRKKGRGKLLDRIENKKMTFYNKVHRGFLQIAQQEVQRFVVINGEKRIREIHKEIVGLVNQKLNIKY